MFDCCCQNENKSKDEFSHLMWETQKLRVLKAGSLERLVEYLYVRGEMDSTYTNVFLATYRTFSTTEEVLATLLAKYREVKDGRDVKPDLQDVQLRWPSSSADIVFAIVKTGAMGPFH